MKASVTVMTESQQDSFDVLYRQYWAPLTRLAWLLTGSREVGEDVVHDAFEKLVPLWANLDVPEQYLRRMVVNGCRDHHRRRKVATRHRPPPAEPVWNPEFDETWAAVVALPDRQRHAIVLRYYADQRIDEIAETLGCPTGTVKSLVHRGLAHIKERLEP
jgi:RNA polymerase sigma factor (sigma-70 family)